MSHDSAGGGVRALARGLSILDLFAGGRTLTQTEVAVLSALPVPTVHRLVATLVRQGYLQDGPGDDRSLRIGPAAVRLGVGRGADAQEELRACVCRIAEATGESANLATLVAGSVVYLETVTGRRILTPRTVIGTRLPAHCTALGKALLAQLPDDELRERLGGGPYERLTSSTVTDWVPLQAQLQSIRAGAVAVSEGEFEVGLVSLAVPVVIPDGPVLALNVALPSTRATGAFRAGISDQLRAAAASFRSH